MNDKDKNDRESSPENIPNMNEDEKNNLMLLGDLQRNDSGRKVEILSHELQNQEQVQERPSNDSKSITSEIPKNLENDLKIDANKDEDVTGIIEPLNFQIDSTVNIKKGKYIGIESLACYRDDDDDDSDNWTTDSDSSSTSVSSLSSASSSDVTSDDEPDELNSKNKSATVKDIKVQIEEGFKDLPPIENLKISVEVSEITMLGTVSSFVEELVVVQAAKDHPALNLDSMLFLENGEALGKIFDVFGQVAQPFYAIRFNSKDEIEEKKIKIGNKVYCAPNRPEFTEYVFLEQLRRMKASDSSWDSDKDNPSENDFSDDEEERKSKMQQRARRSAGGSSDAMPTKFRKQRNNDRRNNAPSKNAVPTNFYSTTPPPNFQGGAHSVPYLQPMNPFSQPGFIPSAPIRPANSRFSGGIPPNGNLPQQQQQLRFVHSSVPPPPPPREHVFNSGMPPSFSHRPFSINFTMLNVAPEPVITSSFMDRIMSNHRSPPPGFIPRSNQN